MGTGAVVIGTNSGGIGMLQFSVALVFTDAAPETVAATAMSREAPCGISTPSRLYLSIVPLKCPARASDGVKLTSSVPLPPRQLDSAELGESKGLASFGEARGVTAADLTAAGLAVRVE